MRLNSIKTLMRPITKKAQRLLELKESGFTVPPFFVVSRKTRNLDQLSTLQSNSIILRGCISTEDGEIKSQAGQSLSLGPIDKRQISRCLEIIFDSTDSIEIIVQEFVDAPTGVLFCYSSDLSFLEYSREPRFVTDGVGTPYCASFPNNFLRYSAISALISEIYARYGKCNIELSVEDTPRLLQIRPLTAIDQCGDSFALTKMNLQEHEGASFIQNEFSQDLEDSPGFEDRLVELYCKIKKDILLELDYHKKTEIPEDFIQIRRQIFVNATHSQQEFPKGIKAYKLGL